MNEQMSLLITDDLLKNAPMSEDEFRLELAVFLFEKEIFTLGKASEFSQIPQVVLQKKLARRKIPVHYGYEEFREDMETVRSMREKR
jgi:predicted HTH domain antitoxin